MVSIKIDSKDLNYLIGSKLEKNITNVIQTNYVKKFDSICLNLEIQVAEVILDFLSSELMQKGFSNNYEPNAYGIMLEGLIDKFSREVYR